MASFLPVGTATPLPPSNHRLDATEMASFLPEGPAVGDTQDNYIGPTMKKGYQYLLIVRLSRCLDILEVRHLIMVSYYIYIYIALLRSTYFLYIT